MINPQIATYIKEERARGVIDEDIKKALLEKGWKQADIDNAYRAQAAIAHVGGLFTGRLDKGNYLKIVLIGIGIQLLLSALLTGSVIGAMFAYGIFGMSMVGLLVIVILNFIIGIYQIGATVRRLHDIGQTGWYALGLALVTFIPVLGMIIAIVALIYLCMTPGDPAENIYGGVPNANASLWDAITGK